MGTSTDAILFYGMIWTDEDDWPHELNDAEWTDIVYKRRGGTNPYDSYPVTEGMRWEQQEAASKAWRQEHKEELEARRATIKSIEKEFGCDVGWHCSSDYPMPYIYITESEITASRGYPEQINAVSFGTDPEWPHRLEVFLKELNIDYTNAKGPGWWLASWWG